MIYPLYILKIAMDYMIFKQIESGILHQFYVNSA
jgi:hypothetical protein